MAEPPLTLHADHDDGAGNLPPFRVVIHATNPGIGFPGASAPGQALATARYFQLPSAGGSAHYVVDCVGEQHCVADSHIAWHAPPNPHSIGIELCAEGGSPSANPRNYSRAQWLSPQVWPVLLRGAARTRELCGRFGIPAVKLSAADLRAGRHGVCGHVDVSLAFNESDHSDPGPNFPWPEFMAAVTGGSPAPASPAAPGARKDDPVSQIPFTHESGGWYAGVKTESAQTDSAVIARQWITYGSIFGDCSVIITALDGAGGVVDRIAGAGDKPGHPVGVPRLNNHDYVYAVPPHARTVTIEGNGGQPVAALISLPK